jgi:hypothetical protein
MDCIEALLNILMAIGFIAGFILMCALDYRFASEQTKWDRAAGAMQFEGYTDWQIIDELGPRPNDKTFEG